MSPSAKNGREICDLCGDPAADGPLLPESALPFCLRCGALMHRACAASIARNQASDSDFRQMFHEAEPGEIDHCNGHELISFTLQILGS